MIISSWAPWLGLFTVVTVAIIIIKRKTRTRHINGYFDQPIYSKPLFKVASIIILLVLAAPIFLKFYN